jgi:hypothetical protein
MPAFAGMTIGYRTPNFVELYLAYRTSVVALKDEPGLFGTIR